MSLASECDGSTIFSGELSCRPKVGKDQVTFLVETTELRRTGGDHGAHLPAQSPTPSCAGPAVLVLKGLSCLSASLPLHSSSTVIVLVLQADMQAHRQSPHPSCPVCDATHTKKVCCRPLQMTLEHARREMGFAEAQTSFLRSSHARAALRPRCATPDLLGWLCSPNQISRAQ